MTPQHLPARLLASSVVLAATLSAQGTFGAGQEITTTCYAAKDTHAADLDGDGALDVLSVSWQDHRVAWYRNLGNGTFGTEQVITTSATGAEAAYAADLDGDGDLDVLVAAGSSHVVSYFPNLGNGSFGAEQVLSSSPTGPQDVYAADLDGDGDLDVLAAYYFGSTVAWFENLGGGSFDTPQVISATSGRLHSVRAGDLDDDGDLDVVAASVTGNKVVMFENQGTGAFGSERVLAPALSPRCVRLGDLDNDGDLDVLYTATFAGNIGMGVAWVQNDGSNTFASAQIISADTVYPYGCGAADLDGDGDLDVLSASTNDDKVAWYENLGAGAFGSQQVLSDTSGGARAVEAADLDGDGDLDVLSAAGADHTIAWFENHRSVELGSRCNGLNLISNVPAIGGSWDLLLDGVPQAAPLALFLLGTSALPAPAPISTGQGFGAEQTIAQDAHADWLSPVDFDGDGDMDLLGNAASSAGVTVSYYENQGQGSYAAPQAISSFRVLNGHSTATTGDLDGDGLLDVLAYRNHQVTGAPAAFVWQRNLGGGIFGPELVIAQLSTGQGSGLTHTGAVPFDADGDGDLDVAFQWNDMPSNNVFAWCENLGGGTFGPHQPIANQLYWAWSLHAADIDGDGDQDLITTSMDAAFAQNPTTPVAAANVFLSDGAGNFAPQQDVSDIYYGLALNATTADMDNDGDLDLVLCSVDIITGGYGPGVWQEWSIRWSENLGNGTFGPRQVVGYAVDLKPRVADMDGDGDLDVISGTARSGAMPGPQRTGWWPNDGSGAFGSLRLVGGRGLSAVADCDGDGDADIVRFQANAYGPNSTARLVWQANQALACSLFVEQPVIFTSPVTFGQSSYSFPVPNNPALVGAGIYAQGASPNGAQISLQDIGTSNGLQVEVIQ